MSDKTGIEWTDSTWNPIRGCSRVSQGCVHCYAEGVAKRFSGPGQPYEGLIDARTGGWNGKVRFIPDALDQPLRWRRPRRIFVNSMSDLFHENIPDEQIASIFGVMAAAGQHTFQVLTKRPERMLDFVNKLDKGDVMACQVMGDAMNKYLPPERGTSLPLDWPLKNVWLGVSVENQAAADERIPLLLQTPAAVRFLSCEPLLGPLDLTRINNHNGFTGQHNQENAYTQDYPGRLHWVIAGGESGRGARAMDSSWACGLRDQCAAAGVPFFFKQWGEYLPAGQDGNPEHDPWEINASDGPAKVGKKAAGRLLDGREHMEYPP